MSKRNFFLALSFCLVLTVIIGLLLFLPASQNPFPTPRPSTPSPTINISPEMSLSASYPAPPLSPGAVTTVRSNQSLSSIVMPKDPQSPQKVSFYLTVAIGQDLGRSQLVFALKLSDGRLLAQDKPSDNLNYSGTYWVAFTLPRDAHSGTLLAQAGENGDILSSLPVSW